MFHQLKNKYNLSIIIIITFEVFFFLNLAIAGSLLGKGLTQVLPYIRVEATRMTRVNLDMYRASE